MFLSEPVSVYSPTLLRFRVSGTIGGPGNRLKMVDDTGAELRNAYLDEVVGARWRTIHLRAATVPGRLHLDGQGAGPLAFTNPVEVGGGSWYARKVRKTAPWCLVIGIAMTVLAAISIATSSSRAAHARPEGSRF